MKKISILSLFICSVFSTLGQMTDYRYKREITGVEDRWHRVEIPDEVYEKLEYPLNDIRIFGITDDKDTIESAYLIDVQRTKKTSDSRPYELLNKVRNARGYYYTLRLSTDVDINEIDLSFDRHNYDWEITIEGSHDQYDWYVIAEDARILSIRNAYADYRYTRIRFPRTRYRYYRLFFPVRSNPRLIVPNVVFNTVEDGKTKQYNVAKQKVTEKREAKQTVINVTLDHAVPVHRIKVNTGNDFDYYRPVEVEFVRDSVKTEKGWKYEYALLGQSMLSSLEDDEMEFLGNVAKHIRITIDNHDNQPLSIENVEVRGYVHELVARFTDPAKYYLVYGGVDLDVPNYDIDYFVDKIPDTLSVVTAGEEVFMGMDGTADAVEGEPLITSKWWLWGLMCIVIAVLGWFTLKMMRSEGKEA